MIKLIFKILIIIFGVILQLVLIPILNIKGIYPNIILISVVVLTLMDFTTDAFLVACFGGICLDMAGVLPFGLNTLFLIGLIFLIQYLITKYFPQINVLIIIIVTFLSSLLFYLFSSLILKIPLNWLIFLEGIYAILLSLIFFIVLRIFIQHSAIVKIEKQ